MMCYGVAMNNDFYEANDREYEETRDMLTMSDNIRKECERIYKDKGQTGVYDFILANYPLVPWGYCEPCEADCPMLDRECLVCGTRQKITTRDLMDILLLGRDEWNRQGIDVSFDSSRFEVTLPSGDVWRVRWEPAQYVGNTADMYDDFDMGRNNEC